MASNEEAEPSHLSNNTLRTYYAMHESMCKAHLADENEHAESTAEILLQNVDLPLYIRARALMILGCSLQPDYVDKAKEAVRIVEVGIDHIKSQGREPGEVEIELLAACKKVLDKALQDSKEETDEDAGVAAPTVSEEPQLQQEAQDTSRTAASTAPPGLSFKTMDAIEHSEDAGFGGGNPYKNPMKKKDAEDEDEASRASASKKDDGDEDVDMD